MPKEAFEYHAPTEEHTTKIIRLREAMKELSTLIEDEIPNCRERSLAITKLEECSMWANKAIVFN